MVVSRLQQRRFLDQVCTAFHESCDEGEVEIAEILLTQMDQIIQEPLRLPTGVDRRRPEHLTAAAERLINLLLWRTENINH